MKSVRQEVTGLVRNPKINDGQNDVKRPNHFTHSSTLVQVRLDKAEAARLVKAIAGYPKAVQKQLLTEIHARSSQGFKSKVGLESSAAAALLNQQAAALDLDLHFASSKRPKTVMG